MRAKVKNPLTGTTAVAPLGKARTTCMHGFVCVAIYLVLPHLRTFNHECLKEFKLLKAMSHELVAITLHCFFH